jgi:UDP-N-acetylglucosamine 2-epimerase
MKKIMVIFGTRPEAIKLCPVILELRKLSKYFKIVVCVTGQHKEMLEQVLRIFNITPDYNLNLMKKNQSLLNLTSSCLINVGNILNLENPNIVIVQGDTTTTFTASLAAFYMKIPVAHVEAGLRSGNNYSPFPEEINRKITTLITKYHFAPTELNKNNLMHEGIEEKDIFITGNTVIDSLLWIKNKIKREKRVFKELGCIDFRKKIILMTGHRRESFGKKLNDICKAIKYIAENYDVEIVYPVHLNPNVRKYVYNILGNSHNIKLLSPLDYEQFVYLMGKCTLVVTDSGGIQEEAPTFRKPILVTRDVTERKEVLETGSAILVGSDINNIISNVHRLLTDKNAYRSMIKSKNPYGDGKSSRRIAQILKRIET